MQGITIADFDERHILKTDLIHILHALGTRAIDSKWMLLQVEALGGDAASELHSLSDAGTIVDGARLCRLASDVSQVVNGEFKAFEHAQQPWITVYAVDSTGYDILTEDPATLDLLRAAFPMATDIPPEVT